MTAQKQPRDYRERRVPFIAGDGRPLDVINVRGGSEPTRSPVLLVHGAGVRASIFRAPVRQNIVDALIEHGYDVWLENWRASIDFEPNPWTLDQAALFDHPQAVKKVVEETGHEKIKAIIHCQGSTSFTMSAIAGLVPQVDTIVSNAVSLHPMVPRWSAFKLRYARVPLKALTDYLNPQWGIQAPTLAAKFITCLVNLSHHECHNRVCKLVSFTYGSGFPALWRHENLNPETHEWLKHEFAHVPMSFFDQMSRCVAAGHLVSVESRPGLPADFAAREPQTATRFAFFAGEKSGCFLPQSQARSFEHFSSFRRNYHSLHLLPNYSHLDVFLGQNANKDVFPLVLHELERRETS